MSKKHNHATAWLAYAEVNRREKGGGFPSAPIAVTVSPKEGPEHADFVDYGEPLSQMKLALAHLDEALPGTQLERTMAAHRAMKAAMADLDLWLRLNGVLAQAVVS